MLLVEKYMLDILKSNKKFPRFTFSIYIQNSKSIFPEGFIFPIY